MSTREASTADDPVIESLDQLVIPMLKGEKPPERWRIGTEHEKLVYASIRTSARHPMTSRVASATCWPGLRSSAGPVEEGGNVIALKGRRRRDQSGTGGPA
jgi:glutamate--cysteine ligase